MPKLPASAQLTLEPGNWYALSIFPGYADCPYHSPIRVRAIEPLGERQFRVDFLNLGYTAGVQNFRKQLRTLRRTPTHIVAEETEVPDRTYVIVALSTAWFERHFPKLAAATYFDELGRPDEQALLSLGATVI